MKKNLHIIITIAVIGLIAFYSDAISQNVSNFMEQGGARWVVGGSIDVTSGGEMDIESGGAFKLAGVAVTSTAAELNLLDGATAVVPSTMSSNAADASNSVWGGTNKLIWEGVTANDFEASITATDPTADVDLKIADGSSGTIFVSTLATNAADVVNSIWAVSNGLIFEGATADAFELTITPVDPTFDVTLTIPASTVMVPVISTLVTNDVDFANSAWHESNNIAMEGATADAFETRITPTDATADRTVTLPNASGITVLSDNITVANSADQACNTTCTNTCIIGFDAGTTAFVACASALADTCLCQTND